MELDPPTGPHPREGRARRGGAGDGSPSPEPKPKPPTVRQVYALAAALCEKQGEEFPETREDASELIERLRYETGHPSPRLEDAPPATPRARRGRG